MIRPSVPETTGAVFFFFHSTYHVIEFSQTRNLCSTGWTSKTWQMGGVNPINPRLVSEPNERPIDKPACGQFVAIDESQLSCYSNPFMNTCSQNQGFPFEGVRYLVWSSSNFLEFSNCRFVWAQQAVVYGLVFTSQARAVSHRSPQTAALKLT